MATVWVDWADEYKSAINVSWLKGAQVLKCHVFTTSRGDAMRFADKTAGARGMVISTLDMTDEQKRRDLARRS